MNQYQQANAVRSIEGYDLRISRETREAQFNAAKAECLMHLRKHVECVEAINFDAYLSVRKERSSTSQAAEERKS
ncbi:hypothetical protein AB870_02830 [Pandoraea faecigallinarum]|uniref:Uncharacterized protein n=1 Tax=Pandoraea faecigallinarum TaxID=656179 RepID=A0A0H3WRV0_9BURK|nr:hypothetical protein [Pandoraea faecigallinarum]AKM29293.1 hypothetical protein AB870_02830 [Pandoraea faecigallinarum]